MKMIVIIIVRLSMRGSVSQEIGNWLCRRLVWETDCVMQPHAHLHVRKSVGGALHQKSGLNKKSNGRLMRRPNHPAQVRMWQTPKCPKKSSRWQQIRSKAHVL